MAMLPLMRISVVRVLAFGLGCFVFLFGGAESARAGEPFRLAVSTGYYYGQQNEPVDRTFRVRPGMGRTFYVAVTNVSNSAQSFYGQVASSGYSSITFEIKDDQGNTNVVQKKEDSDASSATASVYMNPGETKVFDINLNEAEWENAFKLYRKGSRKATVRAIYDNDGRNIYSEYYTIIVTEAAGAGAPKGEPVAEESGSSVLVSK